MTIKDLLVRQKNNNKIAIKETRKNITYKQLYLNSNELGQYIYQNFSNSYTIGIFLPNSINYATAYFSVLFANKIVVPIETKVQTKDIMETVSFCEIDLIITDSNNIKKLKMALKNYDFSISLYLIDLKKIISLHSNQNNISKSNSIRANESEDDIAIMLNTSGTTSNPKKVMLSNNNIIFNITKNLKSIDSSNMTRILILLPMCFGYCNTSQFLTGIYLGSMIIILDEPFLPRKFFNIIKSENIDNVTLVPALMITLFILNNDKNIRESIKSLRYVFFGGAPISKNIFLKLINSYPEIDFIQTYGMTECSPRITTLLPEDSIRKIASVGKPLEDVRVKIVDKDMNELKTGEIGEIIVNGKNVMNGYLKNKTETGRVLKNGWLKTGDLGCFDNEGFLYIKGRIKNILIYKGVNIYPEEIEECLLNHKAVKETLVYGETNQLFGDIPCAIIVLNDGIIANTDEIIQFCKENLASYKIPQKIIFKDKLIKTYNGKLKRGVNNE